MINSTKIKPDPLLSPEETPEEKVLDSSLRPRSFSEFVGQDNLKSNLGVVIQAANMRKEHLEHILLYGPPGLGKTTLAFIIGRELNANVKTTSGPAIERAGDLASLLTNLQDGDVLFIDEIHRLNKTVEEMLFPAMEDGVLDIILGKGPGARSVRMELPKFTLIGATTRIGLISSPLRDRFGLIYHLDYYTPGDLEKIVQRSARIIGAKIEPEAVKLIAGRGRFTPRIANRLLKRVRDFAQVHGHDKIDETTATKSLDLLEIDEFGLDRNDRRLLELMIDKFNGGPVGLSTLSAISGEEQDTIADVHEPFLIRVGFLQRTAKGRQATELARKHLGKPAAQLL